MFDHTINVTEAFEQVEATILSGQMPQERVPGYMVEHPEFAEWYRKRRGLLAHDPPGLL